MLTPEEITRHHPDGEVVYVDARAVDDVLRIAESDPAWAERYRVLAAQVLAALGDRVLAIQHVGSTAVPGLPAKPVIDIDLAVVDPGDEAAYVPECPDLVRHRTFRDWLVTHPEDRATYARAKRAAAEAMASAADDPGALDLGTRYNRIKEPVVREIYDRMFRAAGLLE